MLTMFHLLLLAACVSAFVAVPVLAELDYDSTVPFSLHAPAYAEGQQSPAVSEVPTNLIPTYDEVQPADSVTVIPTPPIPTDDEVQPADSVTVIPTPPKPTCTPVVDIIYVLDSSRSIGEINFDRLIKFAIFVASNLTIGPQDVLVGVVVFSFDAVKYFDLKDHPSFADLLKALRRIPYTGYRTKTYRALDFIINDGMFTTAAGSRSNSAKTVIVFTDGKSDNPIKTQQAAERLKSQGITIKAVGIGAAVDTELQAIASGDNNVFKAKNVGFLEQIVASVNQQACPSPSIIVDDKVQPADLVTVLPTPQKEDYIVDSK